MIDERRETQAGLYAVGALPAEELREFEQALLDNLELQLLVQEFRATTEMLPFALPTATAPAALKARVLAGIDRNINSAKTAPPVASEPAIFPAWVPWTVASCLALLCIGLLGLSSGWRRDTRQLGEKLDQVQQAYAELQREQEALQTKLTTTGSNLVGKVTDLEKQLVEKTKEGQKQKTEFQKQLDKASAEVFGAQRQAALFQNQLRVANREIDRLRGLPPGTTLS